MHQTRKGNQWHFGMKVHTGVDAESGLVHTVIGTALTSMMSLRPHDCCTGRDAFADAGYQGVDKQPEAGA